MVDREFILYIPSDVSYRHPFPVFCDIGVVGVPGCEWTGGPHRLQREVVHRPERQGRRLGRRQEKPTSGLLRQCRLKDFLVSRSNKTPILSLLKISPTGRSD